MAEWEDNFSSSKPTVTLVSPTPTTDFNYQVSVAAARSCYAPRIITPEECVKDEAARALSQSIADSTYKAGHHTTIQHSNFTFQISGVSRHALWSFFHRHQFYNSEQVSQRYRKVDAQNTLIPNLTPEATSIYSQAMEQSFNLYEQLRNNLLLPATREAYSKIFPNRAKVMETETGKKYRLDLLKKTQEVARYVIPIGAHAHLYHSISALTLARYQRMALHCDVPTEVSWIVNEMVNQVRHQDPSLAKHFEPSIPQHDTLALKIDSSAYNPQRIKQWKEQFDVQLGPRAAKLVDYKPKAIIQMKEALCDVLGIPAHEMEVPEALNYLLNPKVNTLRGDTLYLAQLDDLMRVLALPDFTFLSKLSHTADSQEQRQRMSPGTRPLLQRVVGEEPDYITPALISASSAEVQQRYEEGIRSIWTARNQLINLGVPLEFANYLLPNAVSVRFQEKSDLLNFIPKDEKRECLNAQEEIGRYTLEQRLDIERVHPELQGFFGPPCYARSRANVKPACPEGSRFCGIPVWKALDNPRLIGIEEQIKKRVI